MENKPTTTSTPKAPREANPNSQMGRIRIFLDRTPDTAFTAPQIETGAPAEKKSVRTMLHHLTMGGKIWRPEPGKYQSILGLSQDKLKQVVDEAVRVAAERGVGMRQSRENNALAGDAAAGDAVEMQSTDPNAPNYIDPAHAQAKADKAAKKEAKKAARKGIKDKVAAAAANRTEGPCPWCHKSTKVVAGEDPILERVCPACEEIPFNELRALYPESAKAYDAEIQRQKQEQRTIDAGTEMATVSAGVAPAGMATIEAGPVTQDDLSGLPAPTVVQVAGAPLNSADLAAAQTSGEPVAPATESTADADAADLGDCILFALRNGFDAGVSASPSQLVAFVKTQDEASGLNVTDSTVRKALDKLVKKGVVTKPEKGKYIAAPVAVK